VRATGLSSGLVGELDSSAWEQHHEEVLWETFLMADTRIQLEVEDWVRRNWMPTQYSTKFSRERLRLRSGGVFDFHALSEDHSIVATISTIGAKTSGLKHGVGKILKLRSAMLFLTVDTKRRIIVVTERDMCDQCEKEFAAGRVPKEIEFICAEIPMTSAHV
jgi:hypothetical protein